MDLLHTEIFDLADRRLLWLDRREQVLAQNVANADTPNYQPKDLPAFSASLQNAAMAAAGALTRTAVGHMAGTVASAFESGVVERGTRFHPKSRAPDGNAVALDDELTKVADVQNMQALTSGLSTKYSSLFRLALGRAS